MTDIRTRKVKKEVKEKSIDVISKLGRGEGKVHMETSTETTFH